VGIDLRVGLIALLSCLACSCAAPADETNEAANDEEVRVARCEERYGAPLRTKVARIREKLEHPTSAYAREVRDALDQKKVKVLPFCQMTRSDFEEYAKESDLSAFGATRDEQFKKLRDGSDGIMRTFHSEVYGYQWEDRIYLRSTMNDTLILETIGHEARHVFRRAHARNFHDQRVTCVEELEAFRAEVLVKRDTITPDEDRKIMDTVHELYELDKLAPGTCGYR
jgi:hypothetical protein